MIPQLRDWHARYAEAGLTIVGVHSPEFFWERYGVRAWPTRVLVDRGGRVRYRHIGEGAYDETAALIRRLLAERG